MDYDEVHLAGDGELLFNSPYQHWTPATTKVVNYILGRANRNVPDEAGISPGMAKLLDRGWKLAPTARQARAEVMSQYGAILEEKAAGDYVFFRVRKENK